MLLKFVGLATLLRRSALGLLCGRLAAKRAKPQRVRGFLALTLEDRQFGHKYVDNKGTHCAKCVLFLKVEHVFAIK